MIQSPDSGVYWKGLALQLRNRPDTNYFVGSGVDYYRILYIKNASQI